MTKEDKYFDDAFREKLADFSEAPPPHVWEGIQQMQQAAKKNRLFFYLKLSGAAAAVVVAFLLGWQIALQPDQDLLPAQVVEAPVKVEEGTDIVEQTVKNNPKIVSSAQNQIDIADQPAAKRESNNYKASITTENLRQESEEQASLTINSLKYDELKQGENFSILKSITNILLPSVFKAEEEQLATINRNNEPQSLTTDDLDIITRNQQLLAMNEKEARANPWQLTAMVAPSMAVNQTSHNEAYANNMSNPGSKENLSIGGGLAVSFKAGKRWSVQSGLFFSQLGQSSSNQVAGSQNGFVASDNAANYFNTALAVKSGQAFLNATAGVVEIEDFPSNARIGNSLEADNAQEAVFLTAAEFQQNFEYVEIPLNLRYLLIDSRIDLNLLGGFSSNVLVSNDVYLENSLGRERIGETRDMNKVSYSTTFGIGLGYGISNKISMHLEPQVKYFMGSLNRNSAVNFKPYTIGIYTGLSYKF